MSLNLYDTTIPVLKIYLRNLHHILAVGEDYFAARSTSIDPNAARLIDDMYSLSEQVQCACRAAQNIPLLVLGEKVTGSAPSDITEPTMDSLKSRLLATLDFIDGNSQGESKGVKRFGREAFEGAEGFEVTWQAYKLTGMVYGKSPTHRFSRPLCRALLSPDYPSLDYHEQIADPDMQSLTTLCQISFFTL